MNPACGEKTTRSCRPPPDLALEVEIASRTHPETYAALGVRELWRRSGDRLEIYCLQAGAYVASDVSPTLGNLPLAGVIPQYVQSRVEGRNKALRAFRQWVKTALGDRSA